jgi:ATP-binding cassette subfamily B protein
VTPAASIPGCRMDVDRRRMTRLLPAALAETIQELLSSARWALRIGWSTSPALLLGDAALALVRGAVPAALALTARGLVNVTMSSLHSGSGNFRGLAFWLGIGFALTVVDGVARLANTLVAQRFRDDLNFEITSGILRHAATLDVAFFEDVRTQDILQRAKDNPAERIARFVNEVLSCLSNAVQVVSLLALLVVIEPWILLVLVLFTLPYLRFQWRLATRQHALERSRTTKRRWTHYFTSTLTDRSSVGEVRILGLAPLLIERFRALMAEFRDQDRKLYVHGFTGSSLFVLVTTGAIYAMFVRVAYNVLSGSLTIGDLAIFGGATTRLRNTLESLIYSISAAMEQTLYIANVIEFLDAKPSPAGTGGTPEARRAEIEFRDVRFAYPGSSEPALDGVSLHVLPGETVAVVGENGAGKTTLVKLIARLYDPDEGCILFDGVDLRALARESLHAELAFVFQGFGHYEASAADNIAYGDWRRLLQDRDALRRVAEQAGVDDMLQAMPQGYDTMLGRMFGDYDPSGGQWQKIAVARAFARNASLLILDEPTSNLDARAEYELFCRFRDLAKGRTTIIVSHRFSTVSMANRIIVMDRGRIIESGTHDELLARAGSYADLYELHRRQMDAAPPK